VAGDVETGLVVPVPELEGFVSPFLAAAGNPAHITLLYPFVSPPVADAVIDRLAEIFSGWPSFDFRMVDVGWFGEDVVYLKPSPAGRFKALISRLSAEWPDYPPYGGVHGDPTPHLTLADGEDPASMRKLADRVAARLPVVCSATEVWLMQGSRQPASWTRIRRFGLSGVG